MSEIADLDQARRVLALSRQLAEVSRELATHCLTVELALARHDRDAMNEAAEEVIALARRFRELRRGLLAAGPRPNIST